MKRFELANPQIFRVGDIVKAQMTFTVTPLRAKTFKMLTVLRSIALLNPTFSQVRALIYYKY
jgi:hypothetical protein